MLTMMTMMARQGNRATVCFCLLLLLAAVTVTDGRLFDNWSSTTTTDASSERQQQRLPQEDHERRNLLETHDGPMDLQDLLRNGDPDLEYKGSNPNQKLGRCEGDCDVSVVERGLIWHAAACDLTPFSVVLYRPYKGYNVALHLLHRFFSRFLMTLYIHTCMLTVG